GARESGHDDQLVARDLERDVLEVVHARALHGDRRAWGGFVARGFGGGALSRGWSHEPIISARARVVQRADARLQPAARAVQAADLSPPRSTLVTSVAA